MFFIPAQRINQKSDEIIMIIKKILLSLKRLSDEQNTRNYFNFYLMHS